MQNPMWPWTLFAETGMLFTCGLVALNRSWMMWPTDDWWIPVFLETSNNDSCNCGALPDWTWGHQQDHVLPSTHSYWSTAPCPLELVFSLFSSLRRLQWFQLLLENSLSNLCAVYPLSRHKFLIKYSLLYWTAQTAETCEITSFPLPWKIAE